MSGMTLIVDRRGAALELAGHDVIVLREPERAATRIGVRALSAVLLHGEVSITTGVLRAIAEHNVSLIALPVRGGRTAAAFSVPSTRLPRLRHAQHLAYASPAQRLSIARLCVLAKLDGQRATLAAAGASAEATLEEGNLAAVSSIAALMGCEGAASAKYFRQLGDIWPSPWTFDGRTRRPPLDPVNAMLSLGYTLALAGVERQLARFGLDLQVGFLHGIQRDRHSLALDILEAARSAVDLWVWTLCRERVADPERFTLSEQDGCRLDKEGRQAFYRDWFARGLAMAEHPARRLVARLLRMLRGDSSE